ncbi:MAG: glycosyltransferase family 4 protein [Parabacteroides sp.]
MFVWQGAFLLGVMEEYKNKRMLYITVKQTPYRTLFFNQLAEYCDLTVLYEYEDPGVRNKQWAVSEQLKHKAIFLHEESENAISVFIKMIKLIFQGSWDAVVVGCWNLRLELLAMLVMRLLGHPFTLNLDGEYFLQGESIKQRLKRFLLRSADSYLIAGKEAADALRSIVGNKPIIVYYFSSLTDEEINEKAMQNEKRNDTILVVGRNFYVKGMDLILSVAKKNKDLHYKIVGMGEAGIKAFKEANDMSGITNVEFVPFLQKKDLDKEYQTCRLLLLPSRQECWGLVINEAAAFGTPIVSTYGSGAAVEFLHELYPQLLAIPNDPDSLYQCIERFLAMEDNVAAYSQYLRDKSKHYSISISAHAHLKLFSI